VKVPEYYQRPAQHCTSHQPTNAPTYTVRRLFEYDLYSSECLMKATGRLTHLVPYPSLALSLYSLSRTVAPSNCANSSPVPLFNAPQTKNKSSRFCAFGHQHLQEGLLGVSSQLACVSNLSSVQRQKGFNYQSVVLPVRSLCLS
jgi:hypothetical protein